MFEAAYPHFLTKHAQAFVTLSSTPSFYKDGGNRREGGSQKFPLHFIPQLLFKIRGTGAE